MTQTINKYFDSFYGYLQFPIQVISDTGEIIYINPSFKSLWGYEFNELEKYSVYDDPDLKRNGILYSIKQVFEKKNNLVINNYSDSLLKTKEITVPIFKTNIFYTEVDGKDFVVLFHIDQTEMTLAEEEVKKARDGYKEAERLKNTFLNVLSHELRTPLNIILGYASIIKDNLKDKISSEDLVYIDNLYSGSERLFKGITQMLEFAQLDAGSYKLNTEAYDLISVLKNAINSVENIIQDKKLELRIQMPDKPVYVDVDYQCIQNAVNNLLSNAIKFTTKGFVEVELKVLQDNELVICKIKDSGVGISTKYLDHLFQPFSQEDLNIGRHYEGNGLGLALAKRYIERMGGSLLVDSIKGVGSTFSFTLPLSQNSRLNRASKKKNKNLKRILMLDDSSESYDLIKAFLKNKYEIEAHNFRDFKIDHINQEDHGVIIFDVSHNHWAQSLIICRDLKRNDSLNRPLIVISSEFMEEKIKEFYEAGVDKFMVKPFSRNDLFKTLEELTSLS
ncbi:MAG TPA: ATP-binding protein [Ignavibacteriaceae bacterium]|nr:ATP-binding protein [Ignavibacteriaceae bacterium]